jgi:hypothetical protein
VDEPILFEPLESFESSPVEYTILPGFEIPYYPPEWIFPRYTGGADRNPANT